MTAKDQKDHILHTLHTLREYAVQKASSRELAVGLHYHEEDSCLMRFANSAISLNTNEHLIRLTIVAWEGRRRASYSLITDLSKLNEMKHGIDTALELVKHAQPLNYQPSVPVYTETFSDESSYDPALGHISNAERLAYFNQVVAGLETDDIRSSGVFSNGSTISAMIYTTSEHTQYFRLSDADITAVLAHTGLKWEVSAEASAQSKADLDPGKLNRDLGTLLSLYQDIPAQQLALGKYDIVFGPTAIAAMVSVMKRVGFSGGMMKRGYSFLHESQLGEKVLSPQFSLCDDPTHRETFPLTRDGYGLPRKPFSIFEKGIFQAFTWSQDDADEFQVQPTGHSVDHTSLVMAGGVQDGAASLPELVELPRERDLLYIPFLHYMNVVNPSKAVITASSRFGALLLKKDGTVGIPYNVRLTQSLQDVFGDKVAWMSRQTVACNTSQNYDRRNPTAVVVPVFMRVNDLDISHSNTSY